MMLIDDSDTAVLLRRARQRAGLTQLDLAHRAGVNQSVVSAYENGHRQPALSTLAELIGATGLDLVVELRRPAGKLGRLSGPIGRRVRRNRARLVATAAAGGATNLQVFGSVARGEDTNDSDLDLLADLSPRLGLIAIGRVRRDLEAIIGTRVDLVPNGDLKPDVRSRVQADLVGL